MNVSPMSEVVSSWRAHNPGRWGADLVHLIVAVALAERAAERAAVRQWLLVETNPPDWLIAQLDDGEHRTRF